MQWLTVVYGLILPVLLVQLAAHVDAAERFPLSIIHINDLHARYEPTDTSGGTCDEGELCIGGYARTVYTVRRLLEEQKDLNPVYINAGDSFQGTLWYNIGRWNVTSQFLNLLPAEAMTLGNHEFDHGVEGVVPFLEALQTKMLVANMDATNEPTLAGKYEKSTIIERSGRKIGLIGVILETTYDLANTGKLIFRNESEAILEEAAVLKAAGANIIIVISHCGYDVDQIIAKQAGAVIDVIVGAHSHTFLYRGTDWPGPDRPRGDYPTEIVHANGHRVLIVQAAAYAKYVGNITVYFDELGNVVDYEGAPIYMGNNVPEDELVKAELVPWKQEVDTLGRVVIGENKVDLTKSDCSYAECNLGNFFCDAMVHGFVGLTPYQHQGWSNVSIGIVNPGALRVPLTRGNSDVLALLPLWHAIVDKHGMEPVGFSNVDLVLANCGYEECNLGNFQTDAMIYGQLQTTPYEQPNWANVSVAFVTNFELLTSIPAGVINYSQVFELAAYDSPYVLLNLHGKDLHAVLEHSVSDDVDTKKRNALRFLQVAGLRVVYNLSAGSGQRVVSVRVRCAQCRVPQYEPLRSSAVYRVITSRFLWLGNLGYSMLPECGTDFAHTMHDLAALYDYIKNVQPIYTDRAVLHDLAAWQAEFNDVANRPVVRSRVPLQQAECAQGECNLGNLYTDAMLHAFIEHADYEAFNWSNVSLAITTQGNFRVPIPAGNITYKQLVAMCPWENRLYALTLRGKHLLALLEDSVAPMNASHKAPRSKRFLQVSGMRVRYNISAPVGERVLSAELRCTQCSVPSYNPLEEQRPYRLVVMEYLANGKNGFSLISEHAKDLIMGPYDLDALMAYMREYAPIVYGVEGRISILR